MTAIAQRLLGKTGLQVSALSLGTVGLGLQYGIAADRGNLPPDHNDAVRLVQKAVEAGLTFIDTARGYGTSERIIGDATAEQREQVQIVTKVSALDNSRQPLRGDALREWIEESVTESLRVLHTDHVDVLMLHSAPLDLLRENEALPLLRALQECGMTRLIGASTYGVEASLLALEQGSDVLQVAYNVLDQRMADEVFPRALASDFGLTPVEAALRFALSQSGIDSILVGVQAASELDQALSAAGQGILAPDQFEALAALRSDDPVLLNPSKWGIP